MPVDLYIGGAEHAVLHLLYSRFWHKVLFDRGHVSTPEPFHEAGQPGHDPGRDGVHRLSQGRKAAGSARPRCRDDEDNQPVNKTDRRQGRTRSAFRPTRSKSKATSSCSRQSPAIRVESRAYKMSKSRGNVVNPDEVVTEYGADSLRLYEMFMGPLEATKPWSMTGVNGVRGFLDRVWRMIVNDKSETLELNPAVQDVAPTAEQNRVLHKTIQAVTRRHRDACRSTRPSPR